MKRAYEEVASKEFLVWMRVPNGRDAGVGEWQNGCYRRS